MKKLLTIAFAVTLVLAAVGYGIVENAERGAGVRATAEEVRIDKMPGSRMDAVFFPANGDRAVIMVPGMMYGKESWEFLGQHLQEEHTATLALDYDNLMDAVEFLEKKGFTRIAVFAASAGAETVLNLLTENPSNVVDRVAILAAPSGRFLKNEKIDKLFITARGDTISRVHKIYEGSVAPKSLKEYEGNEHAQRLFDGENREDLINTLTDFVREKVKGVSP